MAPHIQPTSLDPFTTIRPIFNDALWNQLRWYATKQFDPVRKVSAADWKTLEETLVLEAPRAVVGMALTPSSFGLQPWRFIVITNQPTKEKLVHAWWDQRQVADASHVVVFAIKKNLGRAEVDRHLARIADGFREILTGFLAGRRVRRTLWGGKALQIRPILWRTGNSQKSRLPERSATARDRPSGENTAG